MFLNWGNNTFSGSWTGETTPSQGIFLFLGNNTFSGYVPELGKQHLFRVCSWTGETTPSQGIFLNLGHNTFSGYIPELGKQHLLRVYSWTGETTPSQGIFLNWGNNTFSGYIPEQVTGETPAEYVGINKVSDLPIVFCKIKINPLCQECMWERIFGQINFSAENLGW